MKKTWTQTITVTGLHGEPAYTLRCEPEGAEHEVRPGDQLALTFTAPTPRGFEIAYADRAVVLCRLGDSDVSIRDKRGRSLTW